MEFGNQDWVVCVRNSSNLPAYNFIASTEIVQIMEGSDKLPLTFDGLPMKTNPVRIHILYPGSSSVVADIDIDLNAKLSGTKNEQYILGTKNKNLLIHFSFVDNSGNKWKSAYRIKNLHDLNKMEFYVEEEIGEIK